MKCMGRQAGDVPVTCYENGGAVFGLLPLLWTLAL